MKSPRLMLVLILGGLGLMIAGLTRMDLNHQAGATSAPASLASSWLTGLAGALMVCAGVHLVRATYLRNGKAAIAGSPGRQRLLWVLGAVGVLAVAGMLVLSRQHGKTRTPGSVFHPGAAGPESSGARPAQVQLPEADEQMRAKLQPVIHCVNDVFSHYEGIARTYHSEVASLSASNKPLEFGVRPMGGYFDVAGIGSLGDPAKECADGLDRAVSMPPAASDLDGPARDAASALRDIAAPGKEMDGYLQQKGYLDDHFSKGRQLDSTITPLLNRILASSAQLRAVAIRENHTLRVHELDAVAKSEGHSARWHVLNTMLASRESNDELLGAFRRQQLNLTEVAKALQPLQAAFDEGEQFSRGHAEAQAPGGVWSAIERPVGAQLADIKELREALAHPSSGELDQGRKLHDLLKSESSDFNNAVEMYNSATRY